MSQHIPLEDLSALLDEALPEARAAQLRAHLMDCARCREERDGLSWTRDFLRAGAPPPLPPGVDLRLVLPDATDEGREAAVLPFPGRSTWWGLGAVAALLLAAFMLRPLAALLGLEGLGATDSAQQAAAPDETGAASLELAAESAPASGPAALSPDMDVMVEAAGTQAVADARGPTALAPLATARRADQARIVDGPSPVAGATLGAEAGAEAGGYIPPEAGISGLGRPDAAMLRELALAPPRATATALAWLRATLAPRLTESAPESEPSADGDTAADLATLTAADAEAAQLLALLADAAGATAVPTTGGPRVITPTAVRTAPAVLTVPVAPTPEPVAASPPNAAATGAATRTWVPALALMVAFITLSLLLTVRARARRRRH